MTRTGSFISLSAALLLGLVAVFLARGLVGGGGEPAATRLVVVAAEPISFGAPLSPVNLREVGWPAGTPLAGTFASVEDLTREGRRLSLAALQPGEPILLSKVTPPNGRATLSTQIDEGMRAVSVRVDEVRGVAGFVLPGDRVDVVLTRGEGGSQDGAAYADILLQNAKVLAVDQLANDRSDKPTVARAVTLELTLPQSQKVILAQGIGRLSLILRQPDEAVDRGAARVTAADLGIDGGAPARDTVAALEKQVDALKKQVEQAQARATSPLGLAEMEARLRAEIARSQTPLTTGTVAPAPKPSPVVTVIRNGSKSEQYAVVSER